jgi:hypothetical protein
LRAVARPTPLFAPVMRTIFFSMSIVWLVLARIEGLAILVINIWTREAVPL